MYAIHVVKDADYLNQALELLTANQSPSTVDESSLLGGNTYDAPDL